MRRRATQWPPRNEKASDRQGKISHLLRIILDNCDSLNEWERKFVEKMGNLINRRRGIEPATALSEKQARKLRSIIFKKHRDYKHAVPSLPSGVKFEDEVRRLLKSQPNPNEARNQKIQLAKNLIEQELARPPHTGTPAPQSEYKFKGMDGDTLTFEVLMKQEQGEGDWRSFSHFEELTIEVNVVTKEVDIEATDLLDANYN